MVRNLPELGTKEQLEAKVKYLEAKCCRLEHTNILLVSKMQEMLLKRDLEDGGAS
jgi:hypothetical protein